MFSNCKIFIVVFLSLLALPLCQAVFHFVPEAELSGKVMPIIMPELSMKNWFAGSLQESFTQLVDRKLGLRSYLIRTDNQLNYWLFGEIHQKTKEKLVIGKDHYVFEQNYIDAYIGRDKANLTKMRERVSAIRELQDRLRERKQTFLLVIAPSKANFYAEYLPDNQLGGVSQDELSYNYQHLIVELQKQGVNYWDGREYFAKERGQAIAPLFCKTGTHWTIYGSCLATREIIATANRLAGESWAGPTCTDLEWRERPLWTDGDLLDLTNIWFKGDFYERLAYPRATIPAKQNDLDLFLIGDSFSWNILSQLNSGPFVRNYDFSYYFKTNYASPDNNLKRSLPTDNAGLREFVRQKNLVMIEVNEAGMFDIGWNFAETMNEALKQK